LEPPMVILITAYEQYALEGYDLDVVDYLVKPVSLERFAKACNKAKALFDLKHTNNPSLPDGETYFFVNVEYSMVKIVINEVDYVEGMKDYIKIHLTSTEKPIITRMSLKAVLEKLPEDRFVRIHKSYIVCILKVTAIKRDFVQIGEQDIPIGDS